MADKDWDNVETRLVVGDDELPDYAPPDCDDVTGLTKLRYVEALPGEPFKVKIKLPLKFRRHGADAIGCGVWVDGTCVGELFSTFEDLNEQDDDILVWWHRTYRTYDHANEAWKEAPLEFAALTTTDREIPSFDPSRAKDIGTIKFIMSRGKIEAGSTSTEEPTQSNLMASNEQGGAIPETATKGRVITERVVLSKSESQLLKNAPLMTTVNPLKGKWGREHVFEVRYRTKAQLQALGCLPPDKDEIEIEDGDAISVPATQQHMPTHPEPPLHDGQPQSAGQKARAASQAAENKQATQNIQDLTSATVKNEPVEPQIKLEKQANGGSATQTTPVTITSTVSGTGNGQQKKKDIRARMEAVSRELALMRELERLQAELGAEETAEQTSAASIKQKANSAAAIKRERDVSGAAGRPAKRAKPEHVDLTLD